MVARAGHLLSLGVSLDERRARARCADCADLQGLPTSESPKEYERTFRRVRT
jgi:hypothetical protein